MKKIEIIIYSVILFLSLQLIRCSHQPLSPDQEGYLCQAFENDSIEMLENYFKHWSDEIQPISKNERAALNDTIKVVYKVFEDFTNFYLDKYRQNKPFIMIQNEVSYSISNLESFSDMPDSDVELVNLKLQLPNDSVSPPSLANSRENLISKIIYPEIAVRAGVQGSVMIEFKVDTAGNTNQVKLIRGMGAGCDEAVIQAVKSAKFIPAVRNGENIEVKMEAKFTFEIPDYSVFSFSAKLKSSINKNDKVQNFRPRPGGINTKPVYVIKEKRSQLDKFIRSECGEDTERKYNNEGWKGWPRANFLEQMTNLYASMMGFHFHSTPELRITLNINFDEVIIPTCSGSVYQDYYFKLSSGKWEYVESRNLKVE